VSQVKEQVSVGGIKKFPPISFDKYATVTTFDSDICGYISNLQTY